MKHEPKHDERLTVDGEQKRVYFVGANQPTLWCATILSCSAASIGFGWHLMGLMAPGFGFGELFILAYILVMLLAGQASALGLISIFTPGSVNSSSIFCLSFFRPR